jgi:hypothetical protein
MPCLHCKFQLHEHSEMQTIPRCINVVETSNANNSCNLWCKVHNTLHNIVHNTQSFRLFHGMMYLFEMVCVLEWSSFRNGLISE